MAWSAPMTAVTGNVHTAAQFNQYWRDNLLASEVAVASTAGRLLVASAANTLVERTPTVGFEGSFTQITNTVYATIGSLSVVATTGQWALVSIGAAMSNDTAGLGTRVSYDISGATTVAASDTYSVYSESGQAGDGFQASWVTIHYPLTPGLQLFSLSARTTAGGGTSTIGHKLLAVVPF
jgi:hypothetical protein